MKVYDRPGDMEMTVWLRSSTGEGAVVGFWL